MMKMGHIIRPVIGAFLLAVSWAVAPSFANTVTNFETTAKQAILMDFQTGAVLYEKNADQSMSPSSMSKMMTAYMVFKRLNDGRLSLDDALPVSVKAWKKGGSKMFVREGENVSIENLLRGIIVQSGNDASIVIAEGISGSEESFAEDMTREAQRIGLENSAFKNATGWPDDGHFMTAHDLAHLIIRTIKDFPEYYHYYTEKSFTYGGIKQGNRNPLLYNMPGADGLKTGRTEAGGYGLAASAVRDGRRLVMVINGLETARARAKQSKKLLEWGFREFANYPLFVAGETVMEAPVWLGDIPRVPLVIEESLTLSIPKSSRQMMRVEVTFDEPIPAPIQEGQILATMQIFTADDPVIELPLKSGADVNSLGLFGRLNAAINYILWGDSL